MTLPINERKWNPPQACSAFRTAEVKKLFQAMAARFPGGVLAFDSCNKRGAKLMRKTWLKEAGITDVSAFFPPSYETEQSLRTRLSGLYVKLNVKMEDYYRIKDAEKKTDE